MLNSYLGNVKNCRSVALMVFTFKKRREGGSNWPLPTAARNRFTEFVTTVGIGQSKNEIKSPFRAESISKLTVHSNFFQEYFSSTKRRILCWQVHNCPNSQCSIFRDGTAEKEKRGGEQKFRGKGKKKTYREEERDEWDLEMGGVGSRNELGRI